MTFHEETGQFNVDFFQRSQKKRIFCAGSACLPKYLPDQTKPIGFKSEDFSACQGEIAAYNILSLDIPQYHAPFKFFDFGEKKLKQIGTSYAYNNVLVFGDIKSGEFMSIYGEDERG